MGEKKSSKDVLREVAVLLVTDPEAIRNLVLAWSLNFHHYSMNNVAWVMAQRHQRGIEPKAYEQTLFGPERKWKEHGRYIRFGVKKAHEALKIFKPTKVKMIPEIDPSTKKQKIDIVTGKLCWIKIPQDFIEIPTYGFEHTEGKPLEIKPEDQSAVRRNGVRFDWFAENAPTEVRRIPKGENLEDGFTDGVDIVINDPGHKGCEAAMLATLFHKTAHVLMHGRNPEVGEDVSRSVRELEAIAVEFACCCYFDIENHRAQVEIVNWVGDVEELEKKADRILSTAERIINHYEARAKAEQEGTSPADPSGTHAEEDVA